MEGIYSITCKRNGKVYIGRSNNISSRWKNHRKGLKNGYHVNKALLKDYKEYGEDSFIFKVEKETSKHTDTMRQEGLIYHTLKEEGTELYNETNIIDYRVISREDSLQLGTAVLSKYEKLMKERELESHEWNIEAIAEEIDSSKTEVLIAVRECIYSGYYSDKYTVDVVTHYTQDYISYFSRDKINNALESFSL